MTPRIHLLHLTEQQLAWISVERRGGVLQPFASGVLSGDAETTRAAWAGEHARAGDSVRVYDGRQRYYRFVMKLPETARRNFVDAVTLRIRQELGLDRAEVAWATRTREMKDEARSVELTTVVGRRDLLAEYEPWRAKCGFGALWVGADVEAIATLAQAIAPATSLLILNADGAGAVVYSISDEGTVVKARIDDEDGEGGALPTEIDPHGSLLMVRGGGAAALLAGRMPAFAALRPLDPRPAQNGHAKGLRLEGGEPEGLDAVLAGALRELMVAPGERARHGVGPVMGSLLEEPRGSNIAASAPLVQLQERLSPRRLAPLAVLAFVALLIAGVYLNRVRAAAEEQLTDHVQTLRTPGEILRAEQSVLEQIKRERASLLPLIQLLHEVTPEGLKLRRVQFGSGGALRIEGTTQNRAQIVELTKGLALSPLLSRVQLLEDQAEANNQFRFQLTADLIARKKP